MKRKKSIQQTPVRASLRTGAHCRGKTAVLLPYRGYHGRGVIKAQGRKVYIRPSFFSFFKDGALSGISFGATRICRNASGA